MQEREQPTRRSQEEAQKFLSGRRTFGLLVLCLLMFGAAAGAAGAERAIIFYSPG
jgi:hypothetical protein